MNFRTLLTLFKTRHLRSTVQVLGDLQPFLRIHFLFAAFELGLLNALRTPASKEELQVNLGIQRPELFESMLEMGTALGELSCDDERYRLKGHRAKTLAAPDGDPLAAFLQEHVTYHGSVYRHLAERVRGEPPGDYLQDTGDLVARSSRIMEPFIASFVRQLVGGLRPARMLEVGCGSGVYLRYAAEAYPAVTGIALDLQPQVVEQAKKNLAAWGLGERFQVRAGDIRCPDADIAGPFDLITLYNNIYYFAVEERRTLFEQLFTFLKGGALLALVSPVQGKDVETLNFDLVLQSTQGCTRLPAMGELVEQLRESGFRRIQTESLGPGHLLVGVLAYK